MSGRKDQATKRVALLPVYGWDCPGCGGKNSVIAKTPDFDSEEEREEATRSLLGVEEWQDAPHAPEHAIYMLPVEVKCGHCDESFPTTEMRRTP